MAKASSAPMRWDDEHLLASSRLFSAPSSCSSAQQPMFMPDFRSVPPDNNLHGGQRSPTVKARSHHAAPDTDPPRVQLHRRHEYYKQHQKWKQKQIAAGLIDPVTGDFLSRPPTIVFYFLTSLLKALLALLALLLLTGQLFKGDALWGVREKWISRQNWMAVSDSSHPFCAIPKTSADMRVVLHDLKAQPKPLTVAKLSQYDGHNPDLPIYLAIKGDVYDVSPKHYIYGPDGAYAFFAGRDASRAFVTGCFTKDHLTHDVRGFSEHEFQVCFSFFSEWVGEGRLTLFVRI